jgi:hypothetical protein
MICSSLILINETDSPIFVNTLFKKFLKNPARQARAAGLGPKLFDLAASGLDGRWNVRVGLAIFAPESS